MYALVSTDDLGRRVVLPLTKVRTIIGRDPKCDVVLPDENVSRQHVKIYIMDNRVEIKDMGSRNGTFLNNVRVDGMRELAPGDEIIVGSNQFFLSEEESDESDVDMTSMRTATQLREVVGGGGFDQRPGEGGEIPVRPDEDDEMELTMISSPQEMIAGIYDKKIGLAKHPSLEVLFGANKGGKFLLTPGKHLIGRGDDCNIRLDDEKISTHHAEIVIEGSEAHFRDLGSTNGSVINNRLQPKATLHHRDVVLLGHTKIKFLDAKGASHQPTVQVNLEQDNPESDFFSDMETGSFEKTPEGRSFLARNALWILLLTALGLGLILLVGLIVAMPV
ncbi:MAG: FHA domain-containing protein [Deltaproteobacteria bacterium]|nr:FHA domain-containing protein [Deltaproteobacteria bacterium]MCB9478476.1 FHA domain-containing protein [Deltaproteobacteria bacterium]